MEKDITEAKLKNGKKMGYVKVDETSIFINNKMATWQVLLLIFIIITSILISIVTLSFIGEGFNKILQELHDIKAINGIIEDGDVIFIQTNDET